ncbi:hypothetical protein DQG23_23415 [Paenibacillus contaminans]|uniref:Uncharacterized protein n=1 Tax=Paenibacillus contaminans TaxID=450362 RepID=A0A329MLE7_9BACL|nr:hypothetical protein DQG23_23415 [Paenibacillus contaminans]
MARKRSIALAFISARKKSEPPDAFAYYFQYAFHSNTITRDTPALCMFRLGSGLTRRLPIESMIL